MAQGAALVGIGIYRRLMTPSRKMPLRDKVTAAKQALTFAGEDWLHGTNLAIGFEYLDRVYRTMRLAPEEWSDEQLEIMDELLPDVHETIRSHTPAPPRTNAPPKPPPSTERPGLPR